MKIEMRSDSEMKDTEINWLGCIPKNWQIMRITKCLDSYADYRGKTPEKVDSGIFLVTARNIKNGKINYELSQEFVKQDDYTEIMSRGLPVVGDVLFTTEAPLGETAQIDKTGVALAQRIIKMRGKSGVLLNSFLKYQIISEFFQDSVKRVATGSTALGIKGSKLRQIRIIVPAIEEQEKIVEYLDFTSVKLQKLIDYKLLQIELLHENEKSLIHQAVTKGLSCNVKMKDSGINWIGSIPKEWNITKIKQVASVKGRIGWQGLTTDEYVDSGPFLVTGTDFDNGNIIWNTCHHVAESRYCEDPYIQLREGDLLITKDGTIGKIALVKGLPGSATLNSGIFLVRSISTSLDLTYLFWVLNSNVFIDWINFIKSGSTINHLYQEKFVDFKFPLPTLGEQQKIAALLVAKTTKIKSTIIRIETEVENLEEYRKSLILEAITGKVKVS